MAKTRTEKIESIQEEIRQLEKRQKELLQAQKEQDRKDRTRRLCKRMGLFESLLPETVNLTDEQFKAFLEKAVLSEYSRKALAAIAAQGNTPPATNPASTAQASGADGGEDGGNGARVNG